MPCFCLISGHLSSSEIDERRARGLCQLFATYLIFQTLYYLQNMLSYRLNGFPYPALPVPLFSPQGQVVTWFLLALLIWRIAMPQLDRMRAPITISILIGLSALFLDLGVNHQNVLSFFPYYVVGNRLPRSLWARDINQPSLRIPFAAFFVASTAALLTFSAVGGARFAKAFGRLSLTYACFNGAPPDAEKDECSTVRELVHRFAFYCCSVPLILGFLSLMPTRRGVWTVPGYMSMYVYLLHPLLLFNPIVMHFTFELLTFVYGREVNVWSPATAVSAVIMLVPSALVICALLSLPATRCIFRLLVEPPTELLFVSSVVPRSGAGEYSSVQEALPRAAI
jgi:fucose 4-O-acetylase-like acetyltransferase